MSLKSCRERADVPIKFVVERLGIDRKTYYNWENKITDIPSSMLVKLAGIFNCSLNDLLDYHPDNAMFSEIKEIDEHLIEIHRLVKVLVEKK